MSLNLTPRHQLDGLTDHHPHKNPRDSAPGHPGGGAQPTTGAPRRERTRDGELGSRPRPDIARPGSARPAGGATKDGRTYIAKGGAATTRSARMPGARSRTTASAGGIPHPARRRDGERGPAAHARDRARPAAQGSAGTKRAETPRGAGASSPGEASATSREQTHGGAEGGTPPTGAAPSRIAAPAHIAAGGDRGRAADLYYDRRRSHATAGRRDGPHNPPSTSPQRLSRIANIGPNVKGKASAQTSARPLGAAGRNLDDRTAARAGLIRYQHPVARDHQQVANQLAEKGARESPYQAYRGRAAAERRAAIGCWQRGGTYSGATRRGGAHVHARPDPASRRRGDRDPRPQDAARNA